MIEKKKRMCHERSCRGFLFSHEPMEQTEARWSEPQAASRRTSFAARPGAGSLTASGKCLRGAPMIRAIVEEKTPQLDWPPQRFSGDGIWAGLVTGCGEDTEAPPPPQPMTHTRQRPQHVRRIDRQPWGDHRFTASFGLPQRPPESCQFGGPANDRKALR